MEKVLITDLNHQGLGIARLNDKVVFIKNALKDEIVNIKIDKEYTRYSEASVIQYINTSKDRVKVNCPYYEKCGGCDLLHLNYQKQLSFKQEKVKNIIRKYLNLDIKIDDVVECDNNFYYRNKITFQVFGDIGFFNKKSNDIIKIDNCLLANKTINNVINKLKLLPLDKINQIICRTNGSDLMIIIKSRKRINPESVINILKNNCSSIIIDNKNIYGNDKIISSIGDLKYLISASSFFQINDNVTKKLYDKILDYCNLKSSDNVIDLYCGVGSIGIYLSKYCNQVLGIEINKYAIDNAIENCKLNNIKNAKFISGDSSIMKDLNFKANIIIVDPPRNGLSKDVINTIIKTNIERLIYVSCDPLTLTRDLNILKNHFNIEEITPFDMFPNTNHVECVSLLTRK